MVWLEVTEEILVCLSNGMLATGNELCSGPLSIRHPLGNSAHTDSPRMSSSLPDDPVRQSSLIHVSR